MESPLKRSYEYIVVGLGGIGSGALYWLSKKRGKGVLGLEQFRLGHIHGGSQDHSRGILLRYFDEKYVRLAQEAFKAWWEVENEAGIQLVYHTGGANIAPKGTAAEELNMRCAEAMDSVGVPYELMRGDQFKRRFPQFTIDSSHSCIYRSEDGIVDSANANAVHVQLALAHGADVIENCAVEQIEKDDNGAIIVQTNQGSFKCKKIVVTAGAWINQVLGMLGTRLPITVTQEQLTYFATPHVKDFTKEKFVAWSYRCNDGNYYGLPIHGNTGVKIGMDAAGPEVTTDSRTYEADSKRLQKSLTLLKNILPKAVGPILETKTCLYTMTPDRNLVIDTLRTRGWEDVIVCCGAGHGFKFASVLGRLLSEIAIDGYTEYDIKPFKIDRPTLTDPSYKPAFALGQSQAQERQKSNL